MINLLQFQILTEKSIIALESNKYIFRVDNRLTKTQIKFIFEEIFDIKVLNVNTYRLAKTFSRSSRSLNNCYKKVILTVESNKLIQFS